MSQNLKEVLKGVGGAALGMLLFIGMAVIGILLAVLFINGGIWVGVYIYPWLNILASIAFLICILILLPLAIFRKTRGFSGTGLVIASYFFGANVWVWSFIVSYSLWGFTGLFIGLFMAGIGVIPIAMLALLFHSEWALFIALVLLVVFTFGFRFLGYYFIAKSEWK